MIRAFTATAALLVLTAPVSARPGDFEADTAAQVKRSRSCHTGELLGPTHVECTYEFRGMKLLLVLDSRFPAPGTFQVIRAPQNKDVREDVTTLSFGGASICAVIMHRTMAPDGSFHLAYVHISPLDGEVYAGTRDLMRLRTACRLHQR